MNFLYKRSVLSRPKLFQEGGGNIFLGEGKPYDINVPISGPSANPAISNKSVEINTTGLSDTINKQKDLSYKWAELQFKYKELGYKEGRDYLEALTDYYDNIGVTREMLNSVGGLGSIGMNQEKSAAFISKQADLQAKAAQALGRRDLNGYANAIAELGQVATQNSDLMYQSKLADKLFDEAAKGSMGYNTPRFMDTFFSHVNNARKPDGTPVQFQDVLDTGLYAIGVNVKSKDIADLIDGFYKTYATEPKKTDTGFEVLPSGVKKVESGYLLPSLENMVADFKSRLFADERGKSYLFGQGLNPDNPNSKEVNDFILGMVQPTFNRMQELYGTTVEYSGDVKKDIELSGSGEQTSVTSIPEEEGGAGGSGGSGKEAEWQARFRAAQEAAANEYGEGFATDPKVIDILMNEKNNDKRTEKIKAYAKEKGLVSSSTSASGLVPGTTDLPNTLAGIKDFLKLNIDPETTKEFVKDGTRYLVTADDDVKEKLRRYKRVLGTEEYYDDQVVRDLVGAVDDPNDPKNWNTNAILDPATWTAVYNLGPATGGDSGEAASETFGTDWLSEKDKSDISYLSPSLVNVGSFIFKDASVQPTSAYRTEEENRRVKGSETSYHRKGDALDYSWDENLFERMTTPGDPLFEKIEGMGYIAKKHDPAKIGYGTALHIHIEPKRRLDRTLARKGGSGGVLPGPEDARAELLKNKLLARKYKEGDLTDEDINYLTKFLATEEIQDGFFMDVTYPEQKSAKESLVKKMPEIKKNFTDNQILYIVAHQGSGGAEYFFKNNSAPLPPDSKSSYKIMPKILEQNKDAGKELKVALPKIKDGDFIKNVKAIESSGNHMAVYKGTANSSAIGKYQITAFKNLNKIKNYMDSYYKKNPEALDEETPGRVNLEETKTEPINTDTGSSKFRNNLKKIVESVKSLNQ
jgi:hypothetical protein